VAVLRELPARDLEEKACFRQARQFFAREETAQTRINTGISTIDKQCRADYFDSVHGYSLP
jgi:hypothetical protein